ncbi:hypothetical protein MPL1032_40060 [Mesorhizobium plurifarium]|uniref:Uncharacterized protein n=1 Tax=Mesorhizobium plurifarium TaxID=69974 RepID=A0A0K2W5F9_MESPL|nr:hypothetical protein MPL1032_40060 [Mesorhizobium plurifarium]
MALLPHGLRQQPQMKVEKLVVAAGRGRRLADPCQPFFMCFDNFAFSRAKEEDYRCRLGGRDQEPP